VLSSMIAATVMMAIGDSLARGLGILGALAIIRFRTRLRDPRNIIFIFASLAIGIASGVYGFVIAISGTLIFCLAAFVLYYSPYGRKIATESILIFSLAPNDDSTLTDVNRLIHEQCDDYRLIGINESKELVRYEYHITLKSETSTTDFFSKVQSIEKTTEVRISSRETVDPI